MGTQALTRLRFSKRTERSTARSRTTGEFGERSEGDGVVRAEELIDKRGAGHHGLAVDAHGAGAADLFETVCVVGDGGGFGAVGGGGVERDLTEDGGDVHAFAVGDREGFGAHFGIGRSLALNLHSKGARRSRVMWRGNLGDARWSLWGLHFNYRCCHFASPLRGRAPHPWPPLPDADLDLGRPGDGRRSKRRYSTNAPCKTPAPTTSMRVKAVMLTCPAVTKHLLAPGCYSWRRPGLDASCAAMMPASWLRKGWPLGARAFWRALARML